MLFPDFCWLSERWRDSTMDRMPEGAPDYRYDLVGEGCQCARR
jgi:hypothetical protein